MRLDEYAIDNDEDMQLMNVLTVFNVGSRREEVAREA